MKNETIGQIISTNRKKLGLTQKALAEQLNVTDKAVSKWERDVARPDINTVPKLAEVLGISANELIGIPIAVSSEKDDPCQENMHENKVTKKVNSEYSYERELNKRKFADLLVKGGFGFLGGFLFVFLTSLSDGDPFNFSLAFCTSLVLAGLPHGWSIVERIIGKWFVTGNLAIMIIIFLIKFSAAFLIGLVTYPIALLYYAVKASRKGSKLRIALIVLLIGLILAWVTFFVWNQSVTRKNSPTNTVSETHSPFVESTNPETTDTLDHKIQYITDMSIFIAEQQAIVTAQEKALEYMKSEEIRYVQEGHDIVTPSSLQALFFLTAKNEDNASGFGTPFHNALIVVGHLSVNIANTEPRDMWQITVLPNFIISENNQLVYETEREFFDSIQHYSLTDVYTWLCTEYSHMSISELILSE